jgi:hypothetical protein
MLKYVYFFIWSRNAWSCCGAVHNTLAPIAATATVAINLLHASNHRGGGCRLIRLNAARIAITLHIEIRTPVTAIVWDIKASRIEGLKFSDE